MWHGLHCPAGEETGQPIAAGSAAYGPTAATMDAAKRLRAVASVLPLSNRCIEDALAFLAQVCDIGQA